MCPQDWPATDLNHRLRADVGLFREPCAQTAGENDCFHDLLCLPLRKAAAICFRKTRPPRFFEAAEFTGTGGIGSMADGSVKFTCGVGCVHQERRWAQPTLRKLCPRSALC